MHITEKTKVPLFMVLIAIPTVVYFIYWLAAISISTANATKMNEVQDQKLDSQTILIMDIRDRVIRIEEKVKR